MRSNSNIRLCLFQYYYELVDYYDWIKDKVNFYFIIYRFLSRYKVNKSTCSYYADIPALRNARANPIPPLSRSVTFLLIPPSPRSVT